MPTYIPPIYRYNFNGSSFVYRKYSSVFLAALICIFVALLSFPSNVQSTYSTDVATDKAVAVPQDAVVETVAVYIKQVNASLSESESLSFARNAIESSERFDIKLAVFLALMRVESGFKPEAVSPMGAIGLAQVIPKWHQARIIEARKVVNAYSIFEPKLNMYVGASALRAFIDQATSLEKGLLLYNGSSADPTKKYAKAVLAEAYNVTNFLQENAKTVKNS